MEENKVNITTANATEWLASSGFLFPRSEEELARFNQLLGDVAAYGAGSEVNPFKIVRKTASDSPAPSSAEQQLVESFDPIEINIPKHLLEKMEHENKQSPKNTFVKTWKHPSVKNLINESGNDPYEEMRARARKKVLYAIDHGWEGPPFSAIQLAKILGIEVSPNDQVMDARTISVGKNKFKIEYNPFQKPTRMNFSISHEIAHTLFTDCAEEEIRNREEDPQENKELEELCNTAASELQLPYVVFPGDANSMQDITLNNLVELAKKYKTSLEALFLSFVQVVNKPCAIVICTFENEKELIVSYYKGSSTFKPTIPKKFKIPQESVAYFCTTPGWSKQETVKWEFLDAKYDIFCIGLSPVRKDNRGRVGIIIVPNSGREELHLRRINIDYGDATKPQGKGVKIIAQVVNTTGSLGRGFGKSLQKNYPSVKEALEKWKAKGVDFRLGKSQLIQVSPDTYVFQMLAQKGLFPKDGKIPLDYQALELGLIELREHALQLNAQVHMPLIGAGNAKGKWETIEGLIYSHLVNHDVKVNIYLWGTKKPEDFNPKASLSLFNEESTWRKEK